MATQSPFGLTDDDDKLGAMWQRHDIASIVDSELSWYRENVELAQVTTSITLREFISASWDYAGPAIVFNQAFNDWMTLLLELVTGDGRPSTRTARALVEHAINMADVATSDEMAARYMAHLSLVAEYQQAAQIGVARLRGNARRALIHRLNKEAKAATPSIAAASATYGTSWKLRWAGDSLASRANRHGLQDLYNYYRIASLIMHGAAGGSLGTIRKVAGLEVYRSGPALELCPMAYHEGHRSILSVISSAKIVRPDMDFAPIEEVVQDFLDHFCDYRSLIVKLDSEFWPQSPPGEPRSVIAIARNGLVRWFWYDPQVDMLFEAETPERLAPSVQAALDAKVSDIKSSPDEYFADDGRWVVGELDPPALAPRKPGGRIIPASAMAYVPRIRPFGGLELDE